MIKFEFLAKRLTDSGPKSQNNEFVKSELEKLGLIESNKH